MYNCWTYYFIGYFIDIIRLSSLFVWLINLYLNLFVIYKYQKPQEKQR